uniref:V-type proton ATPase proteolipid subunit n=1 Tax=Romanomermis culicivorax TaxID=13658 RepID=A0A915KPL2_ROMCU
MDNTVFLAPVFGCLGAVSAISLSVIGAAYGTAKCMIGMAAVAPKKPQLILKSLVPMIMAGVLGIYGLVCAVLIVSNIESPPQYNMYSGFLGFGSGLAVGVCSLAAGFAIGNVGEAGIRSAAMRPQMYATIVLITGFAMVAGMYGMVISLIQSAKKT